MAIEIGAPARGQWGTSCDVTVDGVYVGFVQPQKNGSWAAIPEDGEERSGFATAEEAAAWTIEEDARSKAHAAERKARRLATQAAR